MHMLFDLYAFSFDVDVGAPLPKSHRCADEMQDNYRIIPFEKGLSDATIPIGTPSEVLNRHSAEYVRPSDVLLRWHYEQAVLGHIRGAGEIRDPRFDDDLLNGQVDLSEEAWRVEGKSTIERYFEMRLPQGVSPNQ